MASQDTELIGFTTLDEEDLDDDADEYDRLIQSDNEFKVDPMSSNISKTIAHLQRILQFTPIRPGLSRLVSENTIPSSFAGYLYLQIDPSKSIENCGWKKYYCEVLQSSLTYRKEEASAKYKGIIYCSYCVIESPAESQELNDDALLNDDSKNNYDDLYMGYLESQEGKHCFKIFSQDRIYVFRAETDEIRRQFVGAITTQLQGVFDEDLWKAKEGAAKELQPLHREQFMYQLEKHRFVLKSLQTSGLLSDISLLSSSKKEKSGVLALLAEEDQAENEDMPQLVAFRQWVDYFFVLLEGVLYYFASSRASIPTGFVTLKYATVSLDAPRIRTKDFVFRITTPLRTLVLKTKHVVALSEWIVKLDSSIHENRAGKNLNLDYKKRDAESVLKEVRKIQSPVGTFKGLINNDVGRAMFKDFLKKNGVGPLLPFWLQLREFKKNYKFSDTESLNRSADENDDKLDDDGSAGRLSPGRLSPGRISGGKASPGKYDSGEDAGGGSIFIGGQGDVGHEEEESKGEDAVARKRANSTSARFIYDRFLTDDIGAENSLLKCISLDPEVLEKISANIDRPSQDLFRPLQQLVSDKLQKCFKEFLHDRMFDELLDSMNVGDPADAENQDADIPAFPAGHVKKFIIHQKNKRKREYKFPSSKNTITIGRDVANSIVVDDNRVSRSHARVEYSDEKCLFVDVGSAHGSKLNGKKTLRAFLQQGDVIEIGSTKIHFDVTARKTSIIKSFSNVFSNS